MHSQVSSDSLLPDIRVLSAHTHTYTHQLTVLLKLSGTSPDGNSKRGKELDGRFGSLFKELLFEAGPRGCVFPVSLFRLLKQSTEYILAIWGKVDVISAGN